MWRGSLGDRQHEVDGAVTGNDELIFRVSKSWRRLYSSGTDSGNTCWPAAVVEEILKSLKRPRFGVRSPIEVREVASGPIKYCARHRR